MKKLLEHILPFCLHDWEIESKEDIFPSNPFNTLSAEYYQMMRVIYPGLLEKYDKPIGKKYLLKCKKCGDRKTLTDLHRYTN